MTIVVTSVLVGVPVDDDVELLIVDDVGVPVDEHHRTAVVVQDRAQMGHDDAVQLVGAVQVHFSSFV